ncbi:hypothetical protein Bca52824_059327 [Brassica carinata]|uniref:Uncharacterized protein n=1 Tax=Brassica carinata TaxID=52824 RepID=A0A8X7QV84_BRACI|nr:hypothetical protein Bca52824_059327 [Brassica carinata]
MKFTDSPVIELTVNGTQLSIQQDNATMHVGTSVWPCSPRQVRRALVHGGGLITIVSKSVRRTPRFPRPSRRRARHRMRSRRHGVSPARPYGDRAHRYGSGHAGAQAQPETEQGGARKISKNLDRLLEQSGSDLGAESAFRSGHRGRCDGYSPTTTNVLLEVIHSEEFYFGIRVIT